MNCEYKGFALQDILLIMGLKSRTGELMLESGNNIGTVIFHEGRILQAFSPYSRTIGDLLVEDGIITETELLEMLHLQKKDAVSPIGSLFLKTGKVSFDVIEMMVHEQIRSSMQEFMIWPDPRISFVAKAVVPFDRIHLPVQEFILPDEFNSVINFFSAACSEKEQHIGAPASTNV